MKWRGVLASSLHVVSPAAAPLRRYVPPATVAPPPSTQPAAPVVTAAEEAGVVAGVAPVLGSASERHAPPEEVEDADSVAVPEGCIAANAGLTQASGVRERPLCADGEESDNWAGSTPGSEASTALPGALAATHSLGRDSTATPVAGKARATEDDLILGDVPEVASDTEAASPVAGLAAAPSRSRDSPPAVRPFPAVAAVASAQSLRFMRPTAAALRRQRTLYGPPAPGDESSAQLLCLGAAGAPPSASIAAVLSPPHARRVDSLMRSLDSLQPLMERQAVVLAAAASTHPTPTGPVLQMAGANPKPVQQQQQQRLLPLAAEGALPHPHSPSHRQVTPPQPQLLRLPPAHPEASVVAASSPLHAPLRQQVALQQLSPAPAPVRSAAPPLRRAGSQGHVAPVAAAADLAPPQLLVLTPQPVEHPPAGAVRLAAAGGAGLQAASEQPPLRRAVSDRGFIRRAPSGAPPSGGPHGSGEYIPAEPSISASQWRDSQSWHRREQSPPRSHPYFRSADASYAYRHDWDAAAYSVPREVPEESTWQGWSGGGDARETAFSHGWHGGGGAEHYAGHLGIPGQLPAEQPPQYQQQQTPHYQQQQGAWDGRDQEWGQRADGWSATGAGASTGASAGDGGDGGAAGRGWLRRGHAGDVPQSSRLEGGGRGHPPPTWGSTHYAASPPWECPPQHQDRWHYAASGPASDDSGAWHSSSTWRQQR